MSRRAVLREQIKSAWQECITYDYPNGVINGERALQACLYQRLTRKFEEAGTSDCRRIFVEPTMQLDGRSLTRIPDMVVCDTKNIIAVIELKFHPRAMLNKRADGRLREGAEKDLDTLVGVARNLKAVAEQRGSEGACISINNRRYVGRTRSVTSFGVAKNVLLVWAGVYRGSSEGEGDHRGLIRKFEEAGVTVEGGFLELHAQTQVDASPICRDEYAGWKVAA
jgi:hypothetical protein